MALHTSWRLFAWVGAAVLGLACIGVLLMALSENAFGLLDDPSDDAGTYFAVFALVFGDALVAIFPGESTLNTASVLASDDALELGLVIIAGFLGAWLGDNVLYWVSALDTRPSLIGRESTARRAVQKGGGTCGSELVCARRRLPVLAVREVGRRRWYGCVADALSAASCWHRRSAPLAWSTYTCLMAYFIGTALADFPIASVALACASSAILLGIGWAIWRRLRHENTKDEDLASAAPRPAS